MATHAVVHERLPQRLPERLARSGDLCLAGLRRELELDVERAVAGDEPEQVIEHGQAGAHVALPSAVERHTDANVLLLNDPVGGRHPSNQGTAPPPPGRRRTGALSPLPVRPGCELLPLTFPDLLHSSLRHWLFAAILAPSGSTSSPASSRAVVGFESNAELAEALKRLPGARIVRRLPHMKTVEVELSGKAEELHGRPGITFAHRPVIRTSKVEPALAASSAPASPTSGSTSRRA